MRNLQEQVKKAFCYQKLIWPFTVRTNCSSDLKSFSRSLEHFFLTVGQNNFGNKIQFLPRLLAGQHKMSFLQQINKIQPCPHLGNCSEGWNQNLWLMWSLTFGGKIVCKQENFVLFTYLGSTNYFISTLHSWFTIFKGHKFHFYSFIKENANSACRVTTGAFREHESWKIYQ